MELTYTNDMMVQDTLWKSEKEDLTLMMKLQKDIINEAVSKGFTGVVETYIVADNEVVSEVYANPEEFEKASLGELDFAGENMAGYCKSLIRQVIACHNRN